MGTQELGRAVATGDATARLLVGGEYVAPHAIEALLLGVEGESRKRRLRGRGAGDNDAEMSDAALAALLARHRRSETDRAYAAAYAEHPIDEADEWGDLAAFRKAASST